MESWKPIDWDEQDEILGVDDEEEADIEWPCGWVDFAVFRRCADGDDPF